MGRDLRPVLHLGHGYLMSALNTSIDQHDDNALLLLRAQRMAYRKAKRMRLARLAGSVLLAALAPAIVLCVPTAKEYLSLLAALWAVLSAIALKRAEKELTLSGARLQEDFDCKVLGLPWNAALAGERVPPEQTYQLADGVDVEKEKLRNWYADTGTCDVTRRCLALQRSNVAWDYGLRREYAAVVAGLGASLFVAYLVLALYDAQSIRDYLLGLLIPSLPALLHARETSQTHAEAAREAETTRKQADQLLAQHGRGVGAVTVAELRALQDRIFAGRRTQALVPDLWHWWRRPAYEKAMTHGVKSTSTPPDATSSERDQTSP